MQDRSAWRNVSRAQPCAKCGKPDWCSTSESGTVLCRRVDDGTGTAGVDAAGAPFWIYRGPGARLSAPPPVPEPERTRASVEVLDRVYRALLSELRLSEPHALKLHARGLTREEITGRGYRTLPPQGRADLAERLLSRFTAETLGQVPGFSLRTEDERQWWSFGGPAGLLIPVRNRTGQVLALKVRADEAGDGPRYLYVSSSRHGGPGPGSPVHVPLFSGDTRTVRLTEGELKADVATALSGTLTVSIPGVSVWRPALPVLQELGAERVLLAFDADARSNPNVARALLLTFGALLERGFGVELELWEVTSGKGIDDVLAAGHQPQVLSGETARLTVAGIVTAAREAADAEGRTPAGPLRVSEARELVERTCLSGRPEPQLLFAPRTLTALALLRRYDPGRWVAARMHFQQHRVPLRELDRQLPKRVTLAEEDQALYGHVSNSSVPSAASDTGDSSSEDTGPRRQIAVNGRFMREITADSVAALEAANAPEPFLFLRGSALVRVRRAPAAVENVTHLMLRGILDRTADYVRLDEEDGTFPARPPEDVVGDLLSLAELPFPPLAGVRSIPTLRAPGVLLETSGYDPDSGLLLDLSALGPLPPRLSLAEARRLLLEELLGDFPFVSDAGRAHALALLLEPFVRPLIAGSTPLYLIDAPTRGTGKGLLADLVSLVTLGSPAPVMALAGDEAEIEKRITSLLMAAAPMVLLDNVNRLASSTLAAVLTAREWRGRVLGASKMVVLPNDATWLATGNNVELSDEIARRTIPIRLDAGVARPEERSNYRHPDISAWAAEHRPELVSACLSLVQAWMEAGMPHGPQRLGRFEAWSATLGGLLQVAEVPGFLGDRSRVYEAADQETQEWTAFCGAWFEAYGGHPVTAGDLFPILREHKLLLAQWGGRSELAAQQRLGNALLKRRDRVFGRYTIRQAGQDPTRKSFAYRLEPVPVKTPETPETPVSGTPDARVSGVSGVWFPPLPPETAETCAQPGGAAEVPELTERELVERELVERELIEL